MKQAHKDMHLWKPTAELCWRGGVLQQLWKDELHDGKTEWRPVPVK